MKIEIQGLTKRQRAIADILWGMDTKEDATNFIQSLRGTGRKDAETVMEMFILAVNDEVESVDEARSEIKKFML